MSLLRPGDRVAVVAPSGPIPAERLDPGLAVLRGWGLEVVEGAQLRSRHEHLPYLAATDEQRAADLMAAWTDPGIAAVFAGRGGYGATRLLDHLDWAALGAHPTKPLVGFSDVCALHHSFRHHLGALQLIHGPVVTSLGDRDAATVERLRSLLFDDARPGDLIVEGLRPLIDRQAQPVEHHEASGVLDGGNLAVLAALAGTVHWSPRPGAILILEEVAESAYRIDRLLTQLLAAGYFDQARAVVAGDFADCDPPAVVSEVLLDRLGGRGIPLLCGAPIGHGHTNLAFQIGRPAHLVGGTLRYH